MLKDKVVVIAGGAGLIGSGFARAIAEQRGVAVIADINEISGNRARDRLINDLPGAHIEFAQMDITSAGSVQAVVDSLHAAHGRIDALVNNAYPRNKSYGRHFFDVEYSDFCENLGTNVGGCFLASQKFAQYFKKQGYGNIVNIASIYGVIPPKFEIYDDTTMTMPVEYAAIKSAVIHLTKYMAKYFKGLNIRVNSLSPGGVLDNQPAKFLDAYRARCFNKGMLTVDDLCGTLVYLLSGMGQFVNGQNIVVDDGFSC